MAFHLDISCRSEVGLLLQRQGLPEGAFLGFAWSLLLNTLQGPGHSEAVRMHYIEIYLSRGEVGMVCLLAEELLTKQELETCAGWLATGFESHAESCLCQDVLTCSYLNVLVFFCRTERCMLNLSKGEPTSRSCAAGTRSHFQS